MIFFVIKTNKATKVWIFYRIDIVESEFGKHHRAGKIRPNQKPKLHVETDSSPAFICEKVYMQIDFKKITDLAMDKEKVVPLYMSRAQLKRHTSSLINFSIGKSNL